MTQENVETIRGLFRGDENASANLLRISRGIPRS